MAKTREVTLWLSKGLDLKHVSALYKIKQDKELFENLVDILGKITARDKDDILRRSGGASTLDALIDLNGEQSFRRGRISLAVLINSLIVNAEKELERRERASKKGT